MQSTLWWSGPSWLTAPEATWPDLKVDVLEPPEMNKTAQQLQISVTSNHFLEIKSYSNLQKLIRITAYILLFKKLRKCNEHNNPIHRSLISEAKFLLIRLDQKGTFGDIYTTLAAQRPFGSKNILRNLSPFFDTDYDVIRVGGRLGQSPYSEGKRFPCLISKDSDLAPLTIQHFHEASLHGWGQLTLNLLRQEYWITNAKPLVTKFIMNCITCFRFNTVPPNQIMADLPAERVTASRRFSKCGIDFAGPFSMKDRAGNTEKIYISLFVCLSTKAVHMELVTSLTKEDCLFAIKRFISRRGMPEKILTDNGTNFLGARSDLIKLKALLDKDDTGNSLVNFVNERNCEWLTIPPRAPHFGGLWEAAIKSMKRHMRRIIGLKVLSHEEFLTIINQIEAILNSRPLVALSIDPNDPVALTPAHFLIGGPMLAAPQAESDDANINTRYKLLKKIQDEFWRMWKRDRVTNS